MKILKLGDSGSEVGDLQRSLNGHGASLVVDNVFGPATDSALKSFQASKGLVPDGIDGPLTSAALGANPPAAPSGSRCKILDVSHWEKDMDYSKVWSGTDYAGNIIKITEGTHYLDDSIDHHVRGTKDAGKPIGGYHFVNYNVPGADQARFYFMHGKGISGLWIADIEWASGLSVLGQKGYQIVKDFFDEIEQLTGKKCLPYTNRNFMTGFVDDGRFANYPVWLNDFSVPPTGKPSTPHPFSGVLAHQYQYAPDQEKASQDRLALIETVPGAGKIDVSWWNESVDDFTARCNA